MNTHEIKELLNRFYEGQTTEEEERTLHRYFESDEVAPELAEEKAFFSQLPTAEGLEQRISRHIDQLAAQEKNTRRAHVRWIAGIAASMLLLVSAGLYFGTNRPDPFYQDTYDTPEEAYATTEKAITLLATNVNKGLKSIEQIKY